MRLESIVVLACLSGVACASAADPTAPVGPVPVDTVATMPPEASTCRDGSETDQRHGTACLCCHSDEFGVAGSVDPAGPPVAWVLVTGSDGDVADMAPNPFANFFRHFPIATPLRATVFGPDGGSVSMKELAPSGDCNACHYAGGPTGPIVGP